MKKKLFTRNFTFLILGQISSLLGNYTLKFLWGAAGGPGQSA